MKYKVLTLTQPWATLVALGQKRIETRSWPTDFRGPLLIHAAKGLGPVGGKEGFKGICFSEPFLSALTRVKPNAGGMFYHEDYFFSLPFGAIVAACSLVACKPVPDSILHGGWIIGQDEWYLTDQERAFGDYTPGRYAWLLADVRPLPEPIPARGALGLWDWEGGDL